MSRTQRWYRDGEVVCSLRLRNPQIIEIYTGTLLWGWSNNRNLLPVRVEDAWPPIVEHDTFERVQAILKKGTFLSEK